MSRFLKGIIPEDNHRYPTFSHALNLLEERKARILVETGTARGGKSNSGNDGCSTLIFAEWAKHHGSSFYSADIDSSALAEAQKALGEPSPLVTLVHSDSVAFLEKFNQPIDFLYLDSFDFDEEFYFPSQQHHLKEIIAAEPKFTENSFVLIDDCDLPHGGKGKLVIEYLLEKGWKIAARGYQVLLTT